MTAKEDLVEGHAEMRIRRSVSLECLVEGTCKCLRRGAIAVGDHEDNVDLFARMPMTEQIADEGKGAQR